MSCTLRTLPVTDFMSDHPFGGMTGMNSLSPHLRREEPFPIQSVLRSKDPSKEDIELAQHLLGHSKGIRNSALQREERQATDSPSPASERQSPATAPSGQHMGQTATRSTLRERSQREQSQSYAPMMSPHSDAIPSGQVCR